MLIKRKSVSSGRLPDWFIYAVILVCLAPSLLNLFGFDFSSDRSGAVAADTLVDLSGSVIHTLLEWTAFCTAFFTVILAFAHYSTTRDVVTPVIAVALFSAGTMDAFHTLAAARLIEAVADNRELIPFTWALCRMFNALIMIMGISILLFSKRQCSNSLLIVTISVLFGLLASWSVTWAATSENLPQTMFPDALISRPFDVAPLLLFLFAGLVLYPSIYRSRPTLFTHALIVSAIPEVVVQVHMAFGSTSLFDNHFNIAHFLKIVAYLVPFLGLCLEHVRIQLQEAESKVRILRFQQEADEKNLVLERTVKNLSEEADARKRLTDELHNHKNHLKELVDKRTRKLLHVVRELKEETEIRRSTENELRANQSMLIHTEKMASIGLLAAGVAHEINNPTGYIVSNLESLADYMASIKRFLNEYREFNSQLTDTDPTEITRTTVHYKALLDSWKREDIEYIVDDVCNLVDQTQEGAMRIAKIVGSLSNFARADDDVTTVADINECLDSTLDIISNELKYKCEVLKNYVTLPKLDCFPGQLSQVFMNILVNAAQAIPDHGTIVVATEYDDKEIRIRISDDGAGISPEILNRIFDPFFTTKEVGAGTGLGLSISHGIIEKHGGFIEVKSTIDTGSSFTIHLPLVGCQGTRRECGLNAAIG